MRYFKFVLHRLHRGKERKGMVPVGLMVIQPEVPYLGIKYPGHDHIEHVAEAIIGTRQAPALAEELARVDAAVQPGTVVTGSPVLMAVADDVNRFGEIVYAGAAEATIFATGERSRVLDDRLNRWFDDEGSTLASPDESN